MVKYTAVDDVVESKTERGIRIFIAVMFFLETFITTFPFLQGEMNPGAGDYNYRSALDCIINPVAFSSIGSVTLLIMGVILVVFPMVAFFFFVLDKKSKIKYLVSFISCISCACVITFGIGPFIAIGAVFTLIINVATLFMTTMGFQATRIRQHGQA